MLSGRRIILGVTGGIAAYKAAFLLRALQQEGAEVRVTMTRAATRFVGAETFATLSGSPVGVDIFPDDSDPDSWTRHIAWGEWADLFLIAPCTANTMAKIAGGQADNMLASTLLAARCPVLLCPTMDGEMYRAPATRRNLQTLRTTATIFCSPKAATWPADWREGVACRKPTPSWHAAARSWRPRAPPGRTGRSWKSGPWTEKRCWSPPDPPGNL
ncbi:MAG: flavoprotein [Balneolaceae bacterium]|nr:flavoprotein [Balneolaceae bacterium]